MTRGHPWKKAAAAFGFLLALAGCEPHEPVVGIPTSAVAGGKAHPILLDPVVVAPGTVLAAVSGEPPLRIRHGTYRVEPGDVLEVVVFDEAELSRRVVVGPDGRFNYPLSGSVVAGGRTLNAIEAVITARMGQTILEPQVTVSVVDLATDRIYVTGEVLSPGAFEMEDPLSVMQAVAMAGGFTVYARKRLIVIYNPTLGAVSRRIFDYEAFLANPHTYDFALAPGDTVIVP